MSPSRNLAAALAAVAEARLFRRPIPAATRRSVASLVTHRLGLPGAYAGAFAETGAERRGTARVFTGENLGRNARRRHVLAEESCRTLRRLGRTTAAATTALRTADTRLLEQIDRVHAQHPDTPRGTFCCPFCTVSVWHHAAAGGLRAFTPQLTAGLRYLRDRRDGEGGWKGFPYFYTLSALLELKLPAAHAELRYAAPHCARLLPKLHAAPPYAERRREILRQVLAVYAVGR